MNPIHRHLASALAAALAPLPGQEIARALGTPPKPAWGDVTISCFPLGRALGTDPARLAARLAAHLEQDPLVRAAETRGAYLNLFLDRPRTTRVVIEEVLRRGDAYGRQNRGNGQTIVLDYSSPNIAKPFHFGHLRSTNLGACLARIWEALGYRVWRQNYLGDWGTQFGLVMHAWRAYGDETRLAGDAVGYLVELYVRATREAETDPAVRRSARSLFKRLEDGDPELAALWARFRELSVAELRRTYARLGFDFDSYDGEAAMNGRVAGVIERFLRAGVATISAGAVVVEVADVLGRPIAPCMLRKSDGATTYAARDCAAAIDRWERHHFAANVYVCARQEDHFAQVFAALGKLALAEGWPEIWPERCENVSFGFVRGMSTRRGTAVWLNDVLDEARDRARALHAGKGAPPPAPVLEASAGAPDETSETVGQAAVLYFDVSARRMTDLTFAWDDVLRFEGNTGPYLQYTHARICGVYRKLRPAAEVAAALRSEPVDVGRCCSAEEWAVVLRLSDFPRAIDTAAARREPSEIASHLIALASEFNRFYHARRILAAPEPGRTRQRLQLAEATRTVLASGLGLLGIRPLEAM